MPSQVCQMIGFPNSVKDAAVEKKAELTVGSGLKNPNSNDTKKEESLHSRNRGLASESILPNEHLGLASRETLAFTEKQIDQVKQEIRQETSSSTGTKSGKAKVKGVSVTELFTPQQIREHIMGLKQWVGQGFIYVHTVAKGSAADRAGLRQLQEQANNLKGFILALLSSGFIGGSFIIKKKGLRRAAAASGTRAGVGGYSYLLEPLWWTGMITMIVGEIANFVAYAFAPAILVTPLGALSILVSAVLAHFILKERLHKLGILGCVMCVCGSVIIVIHAPQERAITSVQEIWSMATQTAFLLYVASVILLVFILAFHFAPSYGHTNVLIFIGICSLMGSLSVMSVKALGTSLKLTFEGRNQLIYPETWFFMLVVATCVITQMNYLNKALDTFNTAIVSPIYYVMFTTLTIIASVIMFKDWDGQDGGNIMSLLCGFLVVLSGTVLLHVTKDFERSSSFRGDDFFPLQSRCNSPFPRYDQLLTYGLILEENLAYAGNYGPLSPTLSTRLYNGNGELLKHDEEQEAALRISA
ncbi:hypothetical protein IFM89_026194 [Coptis chinensis]|uniref:Probable magnesium transporter n=1 Tax=Coptis chinensis TaxID=261450 RepID=A0A835LNP2_9MAGN|nr:hypothetical protein IFM89_026194 [Coptis chinensis]